jgi:hypothetical protein
MTATIKRRAARIVPASAFCPVCAAAIAAAFVLAGCPTDGGGTAGGSKNAAIHLWEGSFRDGKLDKDEEQWFNFTASEAGTYYIHVIFGTLEAIYVRVYNRNGSPIGGQASLRRGNTNWYIARAIPNSGTYYIEVWPYYSGDSGTFKIAYSKSATPP